MIDYVWEYIVSHHIVWCLCAQCFLRSLRPFPTIIHFMTAFCCLPIPAVLCFMLSLDCNGAWVGYILYIQIQTHTQLHYLLYRTVLHIRVLLDRGNANPSTRNKNKQTPSELALKQVRYKQLVTVELVKFQIKLYGLNTVEIGHYNTGLASRRRQQLLI